MNDRNGGWRFNDGTPQTGRIETIDRGGNRRTGDGGSMTWEQIGHTDDIVRWRPAADGRFGETA